MTTTLHECLGSSTHLSERVLHQWHCFEMEIRGWKEANRGPQCDQEFLQLVVVSVSGELPTAVKPLQQHTTHSVVRTRSSIHLSSGTQMRPERSLEMSMNNASSVAATSTRVSMVEIWMFVHALFHTVQDSMECTFQGSKGREVKCGNGTTCIPCGTARGESYQRECLG